MNWIITIFLWYHVASQPVHLVRNPRARVVPELDIVYVEWQASNQPIPPGMMFTIRHKAIGSAQSPWKYIKISDSSIRIPMDSYQNGENIQIQIKAEKDGQLVEDWSKGIVVAIVKKTSSQSAPLSLTPAQPLNAPVAQPMAPERHQLSIHNKNGLSPPLHFVANIMSPTTVQLKWQPSLPDRKDVYYLVNVKQLTTSSGSTLQNQQIKTAATSFTLGKMIAGEKYEMTIRSATSQDSISGTAAIIEITMPREGDYYEIGNLIISSHFRTPSQGIVNLTWEVPTTMQNKIASYNVEYSEMGSGYWQKIQFHGASSSAALHHLKGNTEYLLRIKTVLRNNIITESGQFRFKTPKVETNPIHKVDVIYSHDVNLVKLQWILEPHINVENVAGYDVYLSQNKDLPDSQWRLVRLNNKESSLSLEDLKSSTVYYVRVNVRNLDGSIIRAPSVYRFKTIDSNEEDEVEGNSLSYRNIAPGQVEIRWSFPKQILDSVIGATILYTDRKDLTPEQWQKVEIEDSKNKTLILKNLREGIRYSVQIIPRLYTGDYDFESRELFEFKTDKLTTHNNSDMVMTVPNMSGHPLSGPQFQQMSHSETEFMRIVSCDPDAIKSGCSWDEICITRVEDNNKGWCISNTLRDSILNS